MDIYFFFVAVCFVLKFSTLQPNQAGFGAVGIDMSHEHHEAVFANCTQQGTGLCALGTTEGRRRSFFLSLPGIGFGVLKPTFSPD